MTPLTLIVGRGIWTVAAGAAVGTAWPFVMLTSSVAGGSGGATLEDRLLLPWEPFLTPTLVLLMIRAQVPKLACSPLTRGKRISGRGFALVICSTLTLTCVSSGWSFATECVLFLLSGAGAGVASRVDEGGAGVATIVSSELRVMTDSAYNIDGARGSGNTLS